VAGRMTAPARLRSDIMVMRHASEPLKKPTGSTFGLAEERVK
jgi:hypothetical protein